MIQFSFLRTLRKTNHKADICCSLTVLLKFPLHMNYFRFLHSDQSWNYRSHNASWSEKTVKTKAVKQFSNFTELHKLKNVSNWRDINSILLRLYTYRVWASGNPWKIYCQLCFSNSRAYHHNQINKSVMKILVNNVICL